MKKNKMKQKKEWSIVYMLGIPVPVRHIDKDTVELAGIRCTGFVDAEAGEVITVNRREE